MLLLIEVYNFTELSNLFYSPKHDTPKAKQHRARNPGWYNIFVFYITIVKKMITRTQQSYRKSIELYFRLSSKFADTNS